MDDSDSYGSRDLMYESDWSQLDDLLNQDHPENEQLSSIQIRRTKEDEQFLKDVLSKWGSIGLVIVGRSRKLGFDRRKLNGGATVSMFSSGMSLRSIEPEITAAVTKAFTSNDLASLKCLQMLDSILP